MKVVLLCAGYATRMYPLTRDLPKPLLEVAGAPILTHLLAAHRRAPRRGRGRGGRQSPLRRAARSAGARPRAARVPIRLLDDGSTDEANRLGALGDLAFAAREVPLAGHDALVAAGDNLVLFDVAPLARAFARRRAPQLSTRVAPADARSSRYGEVTVDASGRITRFREKPADPQSALASIALYFLPASIWPLLERYLDEGGNRDAPGHFFAWLVERTTVYAEPITGPWWDIGDLDSLADARAHASSR